MILRINRITSFIVLVAVFTSCEKYLEEKSDQKLVVPSNLPDLQSVMDNYLRVNQANPSAAERSSDNYYLTTNDWSNNLSPTEQRVHTWEKDYLFNRGSANDWGASYDNVYRANTVLDYLNKVPRTVNDQNDWNNVKGQALFLRAKSFLQVAFIWALQYDPNTASTTLGIPLRLGTDINEVSTRANLQESYDRIIADLMEAIGLLPNTALHKIRPAKPAALSLLARCYLSMRKYDSCWKYADQSLQLDNSLLQYSAITAPSATSNTAPIMRFNAEVLYDSYMQTTSTLNISRAKIDSNLYKSYASSDRRKVLFFRTNTGTSAGTYGFRGSYAGSTSFLFDGVANDEVYLMRAECFARAGKTAEAMADLNTLLSKRWTGTYTMMQATDATDALNKILVERRKELLMRGLRWMDIKRLNAEGASITLRRILNTQTYTLPPNDLRFALAIPEDVIELSGMPQNPR